MPTYHYLCACGHEWEENIPFDKRDKVRCSKCRKKPKQVIHPAIDVWKTGGAHKNKGSKEK